MILSRLSKAIREQNWFAVALEFVIVVAGVLLAFQISLMSERQADRARVEAQIGLLAAEMRANLVELQANTAILETNNSNLRELRVLLSDYTAATDTAQMNELALYAFMNPSLNVEHFALDRLEAMQGRQTLSGSLLEAEMRDWREVRECHMVRGAADFLLRIVARNTAHENELTQRLTSAPHVVTVKTIQVIRTAKSTPGVPIDIAQGAEPAGQE